MRYHFIFKTNSADYMSKGEAFEGDTPIEALAKYMHKYPDAVFLSMYSSDIKLLPVPKGIQD